MVVLFSDTPTILKRYLNKKTTIGISLKKYLYSNQITVSLYK